MNNPRTVVAFVNAGHFIDHYAMLIFAAAVVVMAPLLGTSYGEFLPYATPGFVAFGAGSLATGWLGDHWSRRQMMAIFFCGIGLSMVGTGFAATPLQVGIGLFFIGAFAAIYHPVGNAMLVTHADKIGRVMGINGIFGNLGVASAALVTGLLAQWLGWRWAFVVPGLASVAVGLLFMAKVANEPPAPRKAAAGGAKIPPEVMRRVALALLATIIASSTTFNAVTVAMPQLLTERLSGLVTSPALIGMVAAGVYLFGALSQYVIGHLIDRYPLKTLFLPVAFALAPLLALAAASSGFALIVAACGIVVAIFGLVTLTDTMIARYARDEWRARAFAARYFVGFTAAGASVSLVAGLYERGGFSLLLDVLAGLCVLVIIGALLFPGEKAPARAAA